MVYLLIMRAFIAIEAPEDVRGAVHQFGERLRKRGLKASWVKPDAMHLTLRFLGDIDEAAATTVANSLAQHLAGLASPRLLARGVGAFPSVRRPSVVWAGVETLSGDIHALRGAVEESARAVGLPPEHKAFHPHLTLARLRARSDVAAFAEALAPYAAPDVMLEFGQEFNAGNVVLFNSTLTPRGPSYRVLQEFALS